MFSQILTIARNTFVESLRQPIFFVLVMLSGILQVLTTAGTGFAMGQTESSEVSGDDKLLLDIGLATIFVCGTLLAAFIATAVLSREIENRTILTIVSKPVARPSVILGKYLGVAGALVLAAVVMLLFLLVCIRHGVLSTAADDPDGPVLVFALSAVFLSLFLGAVCNYLYGWAFSQTTMLVMLPAMTVAYALILMVSKKWHVQPLSADFKPQIMIACVCLTLAILVLTAVATAVSTRLGQVMTIVVCAGVFLTGLLSNYFLGRHAFKNHAVGNIRTVAPEQFNQVGLDHPGDTYTVTLEVPPSTPVAVGSPFYYGPNPNGFALAVPDFGSPPPPPAAGEEFMALRGPSAVVVTASQGTTLTVRNIGESAVRVDRPPAPGDFVFLTPTHVNRPVMVAWALVPNMHYFWLLDAISQNNPVPASHVGLVALYAASQIAAFLALGVVLFQSRDVG
jgi:ABC-2 type transport system permease protein